MNLLIRFSLVFTVALIYLSLNGQSIPSLKVEINCINKFGDDSSFKVFTKPTDFISIYSSPDIRECFEDKVNLIDFNSYSLVAFLTTAGGCKEPDIEYEFIYKKETDEVILNIDIIQISYCRPIHYVKLWFLIPKQRETTKFSFNKNYIRP